MREPEVLGGSPSARDVSAPPGEEMYAHLRDELARAAARVCPKWLADRREDIVQTALLRVMDVLGKREGNEPLPSSYLWRVAYTVTIDEIRRARRKQEVPLEEGHQDGVESLAAALPDPEKTREGREIGSAIRDCLSRLVRPRRLAVTLYLQEHSVPELSRLLGWSAKRGENLVYRGLADLRQCLISKGVRP